MVIAENDSVILYIDEDNISLVKLKSDGSITNKKGIFLYKNIIGKEYGSKIYDTLSRNFIFVLKKTPELIATSLKKKTQTLYEHDISFICLLCNALPNMKIIEAGTGTGCLTYALANCVLPHGIIHTFEYNEERYTEVKKEFEDFEDVINNIKFYHKDIINYNFEDFKNNEIDAIFLDMPNPWLCVEKAKNVLKERGTFVIFLPCIEQVYKIIETLEEHNFCDIATYELINNSWKFILINNQKKKNNLNNLENSNTNQPTPLNDNSPQTLNMTYRLCHKENKTHTGYLIVSKKWLDDEHQQMEMEFKGLINPPENTQT
ncbi:tRNA (adenine(58)-N(1))-methyltransferase catalytic subunit TRM61, putative [Plasmodium chabaudi chabaudi]|uniref:tRNA (adenine(58)-N(1))-methyltransferase n=1 Tax=Plasmodium chabaudi chabaudi TaxID=31271 RepID=A0A077TQP5_PLACU|nr:tRNA (adenine(58)-N(1))-methyltransferase catalytic subunit TRM61, putative [Plasmodium chabaudi chabaudi]SCM26027.1 tRNA (adenine(58)-N(1))-methyltransferase catalytic subunit TRM61, putative [Plasmodium chabaudi chabaudi]VTZ70837.1 tRNA (adenine(58)-N(1))-methyltransferase catalytic subunit TRM61, putative [Plasmodium chabaudi chabaudi]|eukprot:XP_744436.1 tRNA (adenine(58)-N(1))-methyltransferase catalytic subunit TRM61, putative [Plasmodium chabaudi chabaudi]